jgi:hypothetical protein
LTAAKLASLRKRWIRVPNDPAKKLVPCPVCKELHKPEWAEDEEEWVFRNAIDISGTVSHLHSPNDLSNDQIYHATCRAEQMSLTKLMKEEGKRSKSASPVVNGSEGVKVEKRKPEDDVDDEDLSKRARLAAGVAAAAEESTVPPPVTAEGTTQTLPEVATPNLDPTSEPNASAQNSESSSGAPVVEPVVKQEMVEEPEVPVPGSTDVDEDEDAVDSSVLVKTEPSSGSDSFTA